MKLLIKPRQAGKTTEIVERVKKSGGILIVPTEHRRRQIIKSFQLDPFQIAAWSSVSRYGLALRHNKIYIDDLDSILTLLF